MARHQALTFVKPSSSWPVFLFVMTASLAHFVRDSYPNSQLDDNLGKQDRPFFRKHLKLWEGSFVVPKRNCISLAEYCLRKHGG